MSSKKTNLVLLPIPLSVVIAPRARPGPRPRPKLAPPAPARPKFWKFGRGIQAQICQILSIIVL